MWLDARARERRTLGRDGLDELAHGKPVERAICADDHLRGEEVHASHGVLVGMDEIRPRGVPPPLWSRRNPVAFQDVADRLVRDHVAQVG